MLGLSPELWQFDSAGDECIALRVDRQAVAIPMVVDPEALLAFAVQQELGAAAFGEVEAPANGGGVDLFVFGAQNHHLAGGGDVDGDHFLLHAAVRTSARTSSRRSSAPAFANSLRTYASATTLPRRGEKAADVISARSAPPA